MLDRTSAAYNVVNSFWVDGHVSEARLRYALGSLVRRHEILRTTYEVDPSDGAFKQRVLPVPPLEKILTVVSVDSVEQAASIVAKQAATGMDLLGGCVLRCTLIRVSLQLCALQLVVHHVAFDGNSTPILLRELGALYKVATSESILDESAGLPAMRVQYTDFVRWQNRLLRGKKLDSQRNYWLRQLQKGQMAALELPTDRPRPPSQTFNGGEVSCEIPDEIVRRLGALAQSSGCTLFHAMLLLWATMLAHLSGQEEIVVGVPYHGRDSAAHIEVIGYLVNTLAIVVNLARGTQVHAALLAVKQTVNEAMSNAQLPFQLVVSELPDLMHDPSRNAVYQSMIVWVDEKMGRDGGIEAGLFGEALSLRPIPKAERTVAKADVVLLLDTRVDGGIDCTLQFNSDLFNRSSIERLGDRLLTLAASLAEAAPDSDMWRLQWMPVAEEQRTLVEFNATSAAVPRHLYLHDLVMTQAQRHPEQTAVDCHGVLLTYEHWETPTPNHGPHHGSSPSLTCHAVYATRLQVRRAACARTRYSGAACRAWLCRWGDRVAVAALILACDCHSQHASLASELPAYGSEMARRPAPLHARGRRVCWAHDSGGV